MQNPLPAIVVQLLMSEVNSPLVINSFGFKYNVSQSILRHCASPVCGELAVGKSYSL